MGDAGFVPDSLDPGIQNKDTNVFIPVTNALMLGDIGQICGYTAEQLEAASPFDKIYVESGANRVHIESSHDWFTLEVMALFDAP